MKNAFSCFFLFTLFCITGVVQAQDTNGSSVPFPANDAQTPCISPEQYLQLEQRCAHNAAELGLSAAPVENSLPMSLAWPLKAAAGFNDCSFYFISAYVDENPASGQITDYNCGTNTYDSHRGTDIAIFPYPFYKMDNNQVEVVAAAAGTILDKSDGNFDKNCGSNHTTGHF